MEELGQVYARALFESAVENGVLDTIQEQLGIWTDTLGEVDFSTLEGSRN